MPITQTTRKSWILTAMVSLGYMGVMWAAFAKTGYKDLLSIMSISYLFMAPFATGALINYFAPKENRGRAAHLFWYPTLYSLIAMCMALLIKIEGIICLIMAAPAILVMSSLGALTFWFISRRMDEARERRGIFTMLLLPVVMGPIEGSFESGAMHAVTRSQIEISAPVDTIWRNIIRVREIGKSEIPLGLSTLMGFPDPVEATLSHEGVGGVRRASFKGNVVFTETIDEWIDRKKLGFTIVANTAEIPPTTMDEHMIVGGEYFNVLRGTYEIEDLGGGRCLLKLSSNHVATTRLNPYADLWGRILMQDIQNRILKVIRNRCEGGGAGV